MIAIFDLNIIEYLHNIKMEIFISIIKTNNFEIIISNEKLKQIGEAKEMVLATSPDNNVISRVVTTVCHGREI